MTTFAILCSGRCSCSCNGLSCVIRQNASVVRAHFEQSQAVHSKSDGGSRTGEEGARRSSASIVVGPPAFGKRFASNDPLVRYLWEVSLKF